MSRGDWARALGVVSVWIGDLGRMPVAQARDAARMLEQLGARSIWIPEGARDIFAFAALLLGETERLIVASSIASIYARDATAMLNGQRTLEDAFPGRFVLGLGVSHRPMVTRRGHAYDPPVPAMRAYLDALEAARPAGATAGPVVLAALGPLMLKLAAKRSIGANPYFVPVAHTALARKTIGPDALLAVEQAVVLTTDPEAGLAAARRHAKTYFGNENYRNNLLRLGFSEADLEGEGTDAAVSSLVAVGDVTAIRERVAAHLAAGADTVNVQVLPAGGARSSLDDWRALAPALFR